MPNTEEEPQVYYIPGNYDNGGGVLGGRIKTRNCVELVCLCGPIAWLEYRFLRFDMQTNIIIFLVTLIPLAALCIFGIADESLSQILMALLRFFQSTHLFSYSVFTKPADTENAGRFSLDRFLDSVSTSGWKATMEKMREQNALKAADTKGKKKKSRLSSEQQAEAEYRQSLRRQEKAIGNQTKGWKSRAREVQDQSRFSRGH